MTIREYVETIKAGTHLTREYTVDPLEVFVVEEIMPRGFQWFRGSASLQSALREATGMWPEDGRRSLALSQRLYPVLDDADHLIGLLTRLQLLEEAARPDLASTTRVDEIMVRDPVVGYPDMTLRELANLMAKCEVSSVPIVERGDPERVRSVVAMDQVLEARLRDVNEEYITERVLMLSRIHRRRNPGRPPRPRRRDASQDRTER